MVLGSPDILVSVALFAIFLVVLAGPFLSKTIEHNLEAFLFGMGLLAITLNHFLLKVQITDLETVAPRWSGLIIRKSLEDPIQIALAVLVAGLIFHYARRHLNKAIGSILKRVPLKAFVFGMIVLLGLLSSVVTAIIAALLLVEIISAMKLRRDVEISLVIVACFAIGLGAVLTPVGEPLSTIVIKTKLETDFWYLFRALGRYIIPGVVGLGIIGMFMAKKHDSAESLYAAEEKESLKEVGIRAFKVYLFVMALVFLGIAFIPIIEWYIKSLGPQVLFWVNSVSAILDNATLASAEITSTMTPLQINAALLGLLISGGMLIPGNIPNIISANKLNITSKEWAKLGVPLGVAIMALYFSLVFFLNL